MSALDLIKECAYKELMGRFRDERDSEVYENGHVDKRVSPERGFMFYHRSSGTYVSFSLDDLRFLERVKK